ncbi:MAG: hypothetical protein F6K21_17175 [Symploca sp. SIO2D2]|nr:hypothetical protein [Symploca sp. SIO2D2]
MTSPSKRQSPLKKQRWYAGFHCWGNSQDILNLIAQKVQEFNLSNLIPLIRIEKKDNKQRKKAFYLFVAIESESPGQLPEDFRINLQPLPCFSQPAVKRNNCFTYEQIKPMVGLAHKIEEYTNPISFQEPTPTKRCDPFADFQVSEKDCPSNPDLIKLLDWLSAKGHGSWATFQVICQSLKIEAPGQVVRSLKLLGHLETSANGKKWSIAPTALVPFNDKPENLEFYLCGQQNNDLRQELKKLAEVKTEGQPVSFGLPRWKVIFRAHSAYNQLEKLGGISIDKPGNIAQRLAECLPTLLDWQATLPVVGGIVPSQRHWGQYQPETQEFQDCGLPKPMGMYEMRREADQPYANRTLFYEAPTQTWRQGDWYGLRFLALYHGEALQDCCYRSAQKQLVISYDQRWPQLYERALVLASGYLPQVVRDSSDRLWLIYHNITSELADSLTQKLSLHLT